MQIKRALKTFRALSDATRLRILSLLLRRGLCVCELMFIFRMEQSRISHQLRILKDADLVEDTREGRWITYRIPSASRPRLKLLLKEYLGEAKDQSSLLNKDLAGLKKCLRQDIRRKQPIPLAASGEKSERS